VPPALRTHLLDIAPLRSSADLRRLVFAEALSQLGSQATRVAIPYQVYELTDSTLALGLVALAEVIPHIALATFGGVLADTVDRRRLTLVVNAVLATLSLGLVGNSMLADPHVSVLYGFAVMNGAVSALAISSVRAWPARLVSRELLPAAFAIEGASWNANALAGPALAGVLIAHRGVSGVFVLDAVTFVLALLLIARMAPSRPSTERTRRPPLGDGLRAVLRRPVLKTMLALDLAAMFFGMPIALLPALAIQLGAGPTKLGLMYAAPAAGGLAAAGLSGAAIRLARPGWGMLLALGGWCAGILVTGLAGAAWVVVAGLALAGGGNQLQAILSNAITQTTVEDELRGQVTGVDHLVSSAGPALGDFESGLVARWIGVQPTIVLGGLLAVVSVIALGAVGKELRDLTARDVSS
jgi:MFS family permease